MSVQYHVEYDHGSGTYWLVGSESPRWAQWVSRFADEVDHATGHVFCRLFYSAFGRLLFCEDNYAREVERQVISADLARRLSQAVPEAAEADEPESSGDYDGSADSTGA